MFLFQIVFAPFVIFVAKVKNIPHLYRLEKISLTQFRNYSGREFPLNTPVTGITGPNGSGKTNLLDAVYYLCYTKSYFQSREGNNVQIGTNGFRISGIWNREGADSRDEVVCIWKEGKKTMSLNGSEYEKLSDHIGRFNAVMIAPDDIGLINEGSELRRKYMDGILAQTDAGYLSHLLQYQKVLTQRNACLKQVSAPVNHQLLDIYDAQLSGYGSYLVQRRLELASQLPEQISRYYLRLSRGRETVSVYYKLSAMPEELHRQLYHSRPRDLDLHRTTIGPHTEDWQFVMGENMLKTHASQGQKKSFLISLKLAHIHLLNMREKYPLLLLDDIFEKLDRQRLQCLFALLKQFSLPQIFITHTDANDLRHQLTDFAEDVQVIEL